MQTPLIELHEISSLAKVMLDLYFPQDVLDSNIYCPYATSLYKAKELYMDLMSAFLQSVLDANKTGVGY